MTESRKKKPSVSQVLKLIDQFSPDQREEFMRELKAREEFRRDIRNGIDAANRGELKPAAEVLARLQKKAQSKLK